MTRTSLRKLGPLAAAFLLASIVAMPRAGTALPTDPHPVWPQHVDTSSIDPFGCPICGGNWDDFLGLLKIQIDLFASILTGVRFD